MRDDDTTSAAVTDDQGRWYTEHTALFLSTTKWTLLGAGAGAGVGAATRVFLWCLRASTQAARAGLPFHPSLLLPLALPACVGVIRKFAPTARGHGTEAVIAAVHQRSGRIDWRVAPVKLAATILTLAFGGSVGKEGPCAQIGASLTSLFADLLRLQDEDRRRLVICGIAAGFSAVFGTPVSGALFGIEVLYLGRIEYPVLFPCLVAGIVAHLVCGVPAPVPVVADNTVFLAGGGAVPWALAFGVFFGLVALSLIEVMRGVARLAQRFAARPYVVAGVGGAALALLYHLAGFGYAGLGTETIATALAGSVTVACGAFALKILATALTLEAGGSGGIVTPILFIGATAGAALAHVLVLPANVFAAFGFISVLAAAANTPIAAAVMGLELLPPHLGVYAALCAGTAFLIVGHRSVYASQRLGFAKSAGLDVPLGGTIGELTPNSVRIRKGSLTEAVHSRVARRRRRPAPTPRS